MLKLLVFLISHTYACYGEIIFEFDPIRTVLEGKATGNISARGSKRLILGIKKLTALRAFEIGQIRIAIKTIFDERVQ